METKISLKRNGKSIIRDSWFDTLWIAGPGILLFLLLRFLFPISVVPSSSMEPTIKSGKKVLVNKFQRTPKRGDVVVFDSGFRHGPRELEPVIFLKRVVAIPGDTVAITDGQLVVNGITINENYSTWSKEDFGIVKVPDAHYFMLGDNRNKSYDSRSMGMVTEDQIQGRVIRVLSWLALESPNQSHAFLSAEPK